MRRGVWTSRARRSSRSRPRHRRCRRGAGHGDRHRFHGRDDRRDRGGRRRRAAPARSGRGRVRRQTRCPTAGTATWEPGGSRHVRRRRADGRRGARVRGRRPAAPARCWSSTRTFGAERLPERGLRRRLRRRAVGDVQHRRDSAGRRLWARTRAAGRAAARTRRVGGVDPDRARTTTGSSGRPTEVRFFVDGALVAPHAVAIAAPMRPVASDFTVGGAASGRLAAARPVRHAAPSPRASSTPATRAPSGAR